MGKTIEGLTIRIGANVTDFKRDLKSAESAINSTQRMLRSISKATNFDSAGVELLGSRLNRMSSVLFASGARVQALNDRITQLKSNNAIAKLASDVEKLELHVKRASQHYDEMDNALAAYHDELKRIAKENGVAFNKKDTMATAQALKEIGVLTQDDIVHFRMLRKAWHEASDSLSLAKSAKELADLTDKLPVARAEMMELVSQSVKVRDAISVMANGSRAFAKLVDDSRDLDSALESVEREVKELERAIKLDPKNMEAVGLHARASAEYTELLKSKIQNLKSQIDGLSKAHGINISKDLDDASISAKKAERNLAGIATKAAEAKAELGVAGEKLEKIKENSSSSKEAIKAQEKLVRELTEKYNDLFKEEKEAVEAFDKAKAVEAIRGMLAELTRYESKIRSTQEATDDLGNESKESFAKVENSAKKASAAVDKVFKTKNVENGFTKLRSTAAAFSTNVTPLMSSAAYKIISSAEEIDTAYRDMRKTVEGTEEQFEDLKKSAMETSSQSVVSTDEILKIEAMGGQLGICVENLETFATTVSNISASSNIDADTAAEDLGKLSNIMGLSEDQYENFGDALVRLGNNTATTEADIMGVTMRFAAMGTQVGMSADEILAWADAAGASGMGAESAGTAVQKTISDIEKAVAGGGDKLKGFAKVSGMSAKEFKNAWENDASGALEKFVWGLKEIEENNGSATKTLSDLGINGSRQKNLLQALANQMGETSAAGGELTESNNKLHDAFIMSEDAYSGVSDYWGAAGDAAREAGKRTEGFSGSLGVLKNNIQNAGSIVGDSLVPAIDLITTVVQKAIGAFDGMSQAQKETVLVSASLIASFGPLGNLFGAVGSSIQDSYSKMKDADVAAGKLSGTLRRFASAKIASASMFALVAAVAAFGIAAKKQIDYTKKLDASHDRLASTISKSDSAFSSIGSTTERVKRSYGEIRTETEKLVEEHERAAERIGDSLDEAYSNVSTLDVYKSSIDDLMSKTSLGAVEMQKLKSNIDAVNEACGSNLYVDEATGKVYDLSEASDATTESLDELIDGIQETSSESEKSTLENYQKTIDTLGGKSSMSADEMDSLKEAVAYVNEAAGSHYVVDEETGAIKDLGDASNIAVEEIDNLIGAQQRLAKANAYQEGYQEVIKGEVDASRELNDTQKELLELLGDEKSLYEEATFRDPKTGKMEHYKRQSSELQGYVEQLNEGIDNALDLARAEDEMAAKMALSSDAAGTLGEVMSLTGDELNSKFDEAGVSVDDFATALTNSGVSMTELSSLSSEQWDEIIASCDGSVESMIEKFNELKTGTSGVSDEVMQGILQGFHANEGQLSMEGGSMAARLYESLTGQDYGSAGKIAIEAFLLELTGGDVETVAALIGEDVDAGLVAGIEGSADLPAEAAEIMSDTTLNAAADALGVHSPSTKFKEFGEFCDEGLAEGIESGADSVIEAAVDMCTSMIDGAKGVLENTTLGQKFMELFGDQVTTASPTVGTAVGSVAQTASDTLNDKVSSITAGLQVGERYASDIKAGSSTVGAAAAALPEAANKAMSAKSTVARNAGSQAAAAFSSGMQGKTGDATRAAENISTQSAAKLASKVNAAKTHGASMGTNFSSGLLSKASVASSAGSSVGNSAKEAMRVDTTSVGYDFDQGFANGINAGAGIVASAAAALGRRTMDALRAEIKTHSPSKETEEIGMFFDQGLAIGIEKNARDAVRASGKLASDTVGSLNKGITSASYEALQMNIDAAVKTGGVFDSMKANMVTKADIQSAVEAAIAGKNLGSQSITQSVGNVTFNGDEQIRAVITDFVETILMKRGM